MSGSTVSKESKKRKGERVGWVGRDVGHRVGETRNEVVREVKSTCARK